MSNTQKSIVLALSSAFALSMATTTVNAANNPFAAKTLTQGYQVADSDMKAKDGKCGTGKCGASKSEALEFFEGGVREELHCGVHVGVRDNVGPDSVCIAPVVVLMQQQPVHPPTWHNHQQ